MTATAIKKRIISKLNEVDNTELLMAVYTILESTSGAREDFKLSAVQKKELDKRIEQHKSGQSISYPWEDVKKRIKKGH